MPPVYSIVTGFDRSARKAFFAVPRSVYCNDPAYLPEDPGVICRHILPSRNPWINERESALLVCLRDGVPAGRLAVRREASQHGFATFGYFECLDDREACRHLFDEALRCLKRMGLSELEGPYTPSLQGTTGVRLDGFDEPPTFQVPYSPAYYPRLLEHSGLTLIDTGRAWRASGPEIRKKLGNNGSTVANGTGVYELRVFSLRNLLPNIDLVRTVIEEAFLQNWRFASRTLEEYLFEARDLIPAVAEDGVAVVMAEASPVGLLIMLEQPTIHVGEWSAWGRVRSLAGAGRADEKHRNGVVYAIALSPAHRGSRAGLLLKRHFARLVNDRPQVTTTWISTKNRASEQIAAHVGMKPWITMGVYNKRCNGTA